MRGFFLLQEVPNYPSLLLYPAGRKSSSPVSTYPLPFLKTLFLSRTLYFILFYFVYFLVGKMNFISNNEKKWHNVDCLINTQYFGTSYFGM